MGAHKILVTSKGTACFVGPAWLVARGCYCFHLMLCPFQGTFISRNVVFSGIAWNLVLGAYVIAWALYTDNHALPCPTVKIRIQQQKWPWCFLNIITFKFRFRVPESEAKGKGWNSRLCRLWRPVRCRRDVTEPRWWPVTAEERIHEKRAANWGTG